MDADRLGLPASWVPGNEPHNRCHHLPGRARRTGVHAPPAQAQHGPHAAVDVGSAVQAHARQSGADGQQSCRGPQSGGDQRRRRPGERQRRRHRQHHRSLPLRAVHRRPDGVGAVVALAAAKLREAGPDALRLPGTAELESPVRGRLPAAAPGGARRGGSLRGDPARVVSRRLQTGRPPRCPILRQL